MSLAQDPITVTLPRAAVSDVLAMSADLTDRMHALLERNTDGDLSAVERAELEMLVRIAQVSQLLAVSVQAVEQPSVCRLSRAVYATPFTSGTRGNAVIAPCGSLANPQFSISITSSREVAAASQRSKIW